MSNVVFGNERIVPIDEIGGADSSSSNDAGGGYAKTDNMYFEKRSLVEKELFGQKKPVYAMLFNEEQPMPPSNFKKPGEQYGGISFILNYEKIQDQTFFTESDSMGFEGLTSSLKVESKKNWKNRQLIFEHALVSQTIYNLDAKKNPTKEFRKISSPGLLIIDSSQIRYIECQILDGFALDDVKKIRIPKNSKQNLDKLIERISLSHPDIEVELK